jgi:hypothetical protein
MSSPTDTPLPSPSPSPESLACFGAAPLVPGDDGAGYDLLLARVSGAVRPRDVLEEGWVRDVVDLLWEATRLRRIKAALMTACADQGMQQLLQALNVPGNTYELARDWAARKLDAVAQVDAILGAAGLGIAHVMARTLRQTIAEIGDIERMIASVETRRTAALRAIEHHRHHFGATLRRAVEQVETITDADFEVVAPPIARAAARADAEATP